MCAQGSPGIPARNGHNGLPRRNGRDGAKGENEVQWQLHLDHEVYRALRQEAMARHRGSVYDNFIFHRERENIIQ